MPTPTNLALQDLHFCMTTAIDMMKAQNYAGRHPEIILRALFEEMKKIKTEVGSAQAR